MGFIKTLSDSISSGIKDQYLETFKTTALGQELLIKRAQCMNTNGLNKGDSNVISAGSKIFVPESTYALMIDNGRITGSVTTPGMYTWEDSSSGSILSGGVKSFVGDVFDRFRFAGEVTKIQQVFYVNGLEIMNQTCNEYLKLPYPDPFYGNLYFKFRLMFSFRIVDPVKFFETTGRETTVADFMGSPAYPKTPFNEVKDHMEEALNLCATRDKVPFPRLLSNKSKLKDVVNEVVSKLWLEKRGMRVESIALTELTLDEASRNRVEQFDNAKVFSDDPDALRALVVLGFTDAMNTAAANPAGAAVGLAGLGMANAFASDLSAGEPMANAQNTGRLDSCPFCGSSLPEMQLDHCPACNADLR